MVRKLRRAELCLAHGVMVPLAAGVFAGSAQALEFELEDGARVLWGTNISAGAAWRATDPQRTLIAGQNKPGYQGNAVQDDGDLNYKKGDVVSAPIKVISDLEFKKNESGALLRVKGWYDYAQSTKGVAHGSFVNGYVPGAKLDDSGYSAEAKFKGLRVLDAYGYTRLNLGEMPLDLRLGKQVVNWGESLFVLGVNQVNPIDVVSFHKPGMQLKEVLMPVEMAYGNLGLAAGTSLEAFYQLKWRPWALDGCGTYFSNLDIGVDPGCGATLNGLMPLYPQAGDLSQYLNDKMFYDNGWTLERKPNRNARDGGQWGLALRSHVEKIDSEVGLYYMNIHSRLPILSGHSIKGADQILNTVTNRVVPITTQCLAATGGRTDLCVANNWGGVKNLGIGPLMGLLGTGDYFFEYPEDIKLSGASLATNILGWSMGFELTQLRDYPVQLNAPDILHALALRDGPLANRMPAGILGPLSGLGLPGLGDGTLWLPNTQAELHGYDRKTKTQLNINGVKLLNNWGPASSGILIGELAIEHLNIPDPGTPGAPRYGRGFQWNFNYTGYQDALNNTTLAGALPGGAPTSCSQAPGWTAGNPNGGAICSNSGYFTRLAWGYRLMGQLTFNTASGVALKPTVFWSHDVKGSSADYLMVDKRRQLGLLLRAEYSQRYFGEIGYMTWYKGATYDEFRDRDYYSALVGMAF